MPEYAYRAKDQAGRTVRGCHVAKNHDDLVRILRQEKGLYLLGLKEQRQKSALPVTQEGLFRIRSRIKRKDLALFTYNLSALLAGGVPLTETLVETAKRSENPHMRRVIEGLNAKIQEGLSLSESMSSSPDVFPLVYVSVVRVGEATGNLAKALDHLQKNMEWAEDIAAEVKQATAYPAIVMAVILLVFTVLMTFVVPRMKEMMAALKVPLPWITEFTLSLAMFIRDDWYLLLGGIIGLVILYRLYRATRSGRLLIDRVKLALPLIGDLVSKVTFSEFAHYLAILNQAGVDIIQSFEILSQVIKNRVIAQGIDEARQRIIEGATLVKALEACPYFPPIVLQMVSVGEVTGKLDEALERVCVYYDRETRTSVKRLLSVLQPALIVGVAGAVLLFAFSLYLPFFKMIGGIKGVG